VPTLLFIRLATFSHRMYSSDDAPAALKTQIRSNVASLVNEVDPSLSLSLRTRQVARVACSNLKFGELTFGKIFSKLINHCILFSNLFLDEISFYNFLI